MSDLLFALGSVAVIAGVFTLGHALFGAWFDGPTVGRRRK